MRSETSEPPELHALACFVHGALTALHIMGAVYHCRRRNWWDVTVHFAAAGYDARSVRHHYGRADRSPAAIVEKPAGQER